MELFIPRGRFHGCVDRLSPERQARGSGGQTLLPESIALAGPSPAEGDQCGWKPFYPKAIAELKQTAELGRGCRCRPVRYLNDVVEQDHRAIKRRVRASQGFRAFYSAWRTLQEIETVNMIRKGQVRWLPKHDIAGQAAFVGRLFGLTTA